MKVKEETNILPRRQLSFPENAQIDGLLSKRNRKVPFNEARAFRMEIGIFANESDDNFLGSRDLDDEYGSEYQVSSFTIFYLLTPYPQCAFHATYPKRLSAKLGSPSFSVDISPLMSCAAGCNGYCECSAQVSYNIPNPLCLFMY